MLALSLEPEQYQSVIDRGLQALERHATPDGAYRLSRGREEAIWPTSLVLFVQSVLNQQPEQIEKTASALLNRRGQAVDNDEAAAKHDINLTLVGWPWADDTFSWVEPTAWACLALRRVGYGNHPRVEEGLRLLLDRALDEGGINYGNRRIFGRMTDPIPTPTALMLLASQGQENHPRIATALEYLQRQLADTYLDVENLCWAKLALDAYRQRSEIAAVLPLLDERINDANRARLEVNWLRPAPLREALMALALNTETANPFRLIKSELATVTPSPLHPVTPSPIRRPGLSQRLKSTFRGVLIGGIGRLRQPPPFSAVHIAPVTDYNGDLAGLLQRQYQAFRLHVPLAGKRVVLKPNLVEFHRDKVINTDPRVVAAAIELCRREGAAEVIVAEGPGHWRNAEYLVGASGLGDVLSHYAVPFVDLNHDEPVKTPNLGRLTRLEDLYLSQTVATCDVLISMPKLKTHHWAGATLSLKNLFGTMPGICYGWPKNELHWRGIDNSIVDIALTRTPDLAIVDGIIGMEGDGPLNGVAKPLGAIIMGADPLAVDATCCRLMKLDPQRVGYLMLGYRKKLGLLGEAEIPQLGEKVKTLAQPFETLPQFQQLYMGRTA